MTLDLGTRDRKAHPTWGTFNGQAKRLTHFGRKDDADEGGAHILLTTRVPNLLAIISPLTATHRYHKNRKQEVYTSPNHLSMT